MIRSVVLPLAGLTLAPTIFADGLAARDFGVRDFGAVGDGETLDTKAIQVAIDRYAAEGGGRVVLASGRVVYRGITGSRMCEGRSRS